MSILKIHECPLCGKKDFNRLMTCKDHYATGETFDLCQCVHCGFIFTQNVPSEDEIGRYYESPDYISHTDTHKGLMNSVYHKVRRYMLSRKYALVCRYAAADKGKLLDIGAGTGYFAHFMQTKGWTVTAIEKSDKARQFAKDNFGLNVLPPQQLAGLESNSFHVVTLWHVMEHLEHLNDTWNQLNRILNPDGILVVAVPNPLSADADHYGNMWAAYDVPRHLWHFSAPVMQQFGAKHGFELVKEYPMPFDAFYVSMLTERYKESGLPFFKGLVVGTKAWCSALGNKEKSSSIIYIFRKKQ